MKKFIFMMMMAVTLAGCSTAAQRQADCQAQGISKDTCYLAEQNRQNAINNAAMKQAMENANKAANP
ncbi:hypothetical protein [Dryocola sp. BD626]|jgi:uncharacterized protein YceK|uniref:hypothetical protein n=1 Tax=Dryocola sp. BD626 TaxID=3133273 RepID=UPI003F4F7ED7